ncbi:MAG: HupE/UreJ family protein [Gammaproteobacteria bacterium]|nr:HupE/UreJ family protein [Gammaproteobacteria bacterium]
MLVKRNLFILITGLVLFALFSNLAFAHGMSGAEKQAIIDGGNVQYLWLGATHMLSGYDHLAFVFGIIFFLTTFRDIAKYVTAFTLGHSVTLIFATFNAIQLNYFLIDAVIALSVCYIAFANIDGFRKYLGINPPNMMLMIIGLGLIHGFGLSTRLQELPLSEDGLLLNIISFNIGIELGQISALFLMLLLIAAWRKTHGFKAFSLIANYALIAMGIYLFFMQMHGYEHTINKELGASKEASAQSTAVQGGLASMESTEWKDSIAVTIPARGDKEYKLFLAKGATFNYSWRTDGEPLFYDFHGEPAGDTTGYFKSFHKSTESQSSGSLTSTFAGTHGWYWKNNTHTPITISLKVNGEYQLVDKNKVINEPAPKLQARHESID